MRQWPSVFYFSPSKLAQAVCLIATSVVMGCASKNPLMEEPGAAKPISPETTVAQTGTTQPTQGANNTGAGVQTTKEKRLFGIFSPYRIDIQQGNFVSREMVGQIQPGMTPDQVRFILGTPLLADVFHANRWDYAFRLEKGNGEIITSRVSVHFQDNRVARVDAGSLPTEQDYLSLIAGSARKPPKADNK